MRPKVVKMVRRGRRATPAPRPRHQTPVPIPADDQAAPLDEVQAAPPGPSDHEEKC